MAQASCPYVIHTWRMEDGLPENRVRSVLQTRDGYIWVGTFNGLVRFDGASFRALDPANTPGLKDGAIRSMFEDSQGMLWLGHHNGQLTTFRRGRFSPCPVPQGWPNAEVDSFAEDHAGHVWVMNRGGWLARFHEGLEMGVVPPSAEWLVNHLHVDVAGGLWTHRNSEVIPLGPGGRALPDPQLRPPIRAPLLSCASRVGGIWVADTGLRRWEGGRWVEDRGPLPWDAPGLTALMETAGGDVWVGTYSQGIHVAPRHGTAHQVGVAEGLSHNTVSALLEDREGNVWVGTGGGGLNMLRRKRVSMVRPEDNGRRHPVLAVTTNRAGGLWVGTEGAGLYAHHGGAWRNFDDRHGILRRDAWSVHEDRRGRVWVGSAWNGILLKSGDRFIPAPGWPEKSWIIYSLFEDSAGTLWAGGERGLGRLQGDAWQVLDLHPDIVEERVRQVAEDRSGTIWLATAGNGLWRFQSGALSHLGPAEGLAAKYLTCLHVDSAGTLWIGSKGGGLWRYRDGQFACVTSQHGLPGDTVMSILGDRCGHLWLSTFRGLARADPEALNACADRRRPTVEFLQLDLADGLATLEFEGPNQPNACQSEDGRLWFATGAGLAVVDPGSLVINQLAPPTVIDELLVDGKPVLQGHELPPQQVGSNPPRPSTVARSQPAIDISPGRHRIEVRYSGLSFAAPRRVRFRSRLDGLDEHWSDVGNTRVAQYNYLPPGTYRFAVIGCNNDGVWSASEASVTFRQLPHYWQTRWFHVGTAGTSAACVAMAAIAVNRRRHRLKLANLQRQRAVELERMRIAQDIHDDLGAHLTRISLLSESALARLPDPAPTRSELQRIWKTSHDVTCALDEIVWAINPRHDNLNGLLNYLTNHAQENLDAAGVRLRLALPVSLPALPLPVETRHNLFLAAKEALNNALKHARAAEVTLALHLDLDHDPDARRFHLVVADDGVGFAHARAGEGLRNMRQRMSDIGGSCEVEGRPGAGTTIRFTVPVKQAVESSVEHAPATHPSIP
jgi:ligand-binding sensor domain-containing protein/signal transduction histidine kinase